MDTPDRTESDRLKPLEALAREPERFSFFQAVRLLERQHADRPRIGTSRRLRDDPVRFTQDPELDFAPAALSGFRTGGEGTPARLSVRFMGLTGPNGPLPLHLTEYVRDRQRNAGDATPVRFFDTFHHRLLSLFYRAWAEAQPTVSLDRPGEDAFGRWVASFAGHGMASLRGRDAVPDGARIAGAGLLSRSVRNAEGLAALLTDFFRVPVQVRQWQPHWMRLPQDARTRLGKGQASAQLGRTTVVGQRVWDCQSHYQVVIGPLNWSQYRRFLPGGESMARLKDWALNYSGFELSCNARLILRREEVPRLRLGGNTQLGLSAWLGARRTRHDADELVLKVL